MHRAGEEIRRRHIVAVIESIRMTIIADTRGVHDPVYKQFTQQYDRIIIKRCYC